MESSPGSHLNAQVRDVVYSVHKSFKWEKENQTVMYGLDQAMQRTVAATNISRATAYRICKEGESSRRIIWSFKFSRTKENYPRRLQILMNLISVS